MSFSFAVNRSPVGVALECVAALLGLGVFTLASFASVAHAAVAVGSTPGSHQVSPSGAFTYTIPIAVPPGTGGIEPKLGLAYNSQGGNGLLGMGWSLAGLSVIHRCPRTVVQDGVLGSVNYDANDRYCLDGQRLVAVSGAYGADATEYRTENESYSRIVSYGSQGSGPAWWKVWTKSGQIIEYGNTADSRIEAQGKTEVTLWSLNKLSDTVGNYLTVSYIEDNPNGQYYPDRIDYTGNISAGKTPANSVRFVYETRPDIVLISQPTTTGRINVRPRSLQAYVGTTTLVHEYLLGYVQGVPTNRSRLTTIAESVADGTSLAPTRFDWARTTIGLLNSTWSGGHGVGDSGWQMADLFNDGRQVYYTHSSNGTHYATRLNSDGTVQNWTWSGGHGVGDSGWQMADLFGDGRQVYYTHSSNGTHYATRLNSDGTIQNWTWSGGHGVGDSGWQMADLFGDGRQVYYTHSGNGTHYLTGFASSVPDVLTAVTNGLGVATTVTYRPLTDGNVYTKNGTAVYPYRDLQVPLYVVSSVSTSDGIGGDHLTDYSYAGAKSHQLGGGFLGFRQVSAYDPQAHIRSITTYRQDYPYQGQPLSTQKLTDSNILLSQSTITYTDQLLNASLSPTWHQSLPTHSVESTYELTGGLISTVITDTQYDAYGNPTSIVVNSGAGYSKTTTNTYDNIINAKHWFLGRLRRSTVNSVTP